VGGSKGKKVVKVYLFTITYCHIVAGSLILVINFLIKQIKVYITFYKFK